MYAPLKTYNFRKLFYTPHFNGHVFRKKQILFVAASFQCLHVWERVARISWSTKVRFPYVDLVDNITRSSSSQAVYNPRPNKYYMIRINSPSKAVLNLLEFKGCRTWRAQNTVSFHLSPNQKRNLPISFIYINDSRYI